MRGSMAALILHPADMEAWCQVGKGKTMKRERWGTRSSVSHLAYHRAWLLSVFASDSSWNNNDDFASLYAEVGDQLARRKLILALGRSHQDFWFRARKNDVFDMDSWQRRAFLVAASCLPPDERKHWYRALETKLDVLDNAVVKWARNAPF